MKPATLCRLLLALAVLHGIACAEETTTEEKKPGFFSRVKRGVTGLFDGKKDEPAPTKDAPPEKPKSKAKSDDTKAPAKKPAAKSEDQPKPKSDEKPKPKAAPKPAPKVEDKTVAKKDDKSASEKKPEAKPTADKPPAPAKDVPKSEPTTTKAAPPPTEKKEEKPATTADAASKKDPPPAKPDAKSDPKPKDMKGVEGEFDDISAAFGAKKETPPTKPDAKSASTKEPEPPPADNLPPPPPLPSADGSWEIVKLHGRDYVTADSIQRFFRFSTLKRDGNHVWLRSPTILMRIDIGSLELTINNVKFILSNEATEANGKALISRLDLVKMLDPVLRPSHINTSEPFDTVVIDAGHGGHDSGAKGVYGYEKDYTLQMAFSVRDALQKRGFKTVLTRSTDDFISLGGRVEIANATPRSIFISLHFNSSGPDANGIETWALSPQGASSTFMGSRGWDNSAFSGNKRDSENIALATAVHGMVIHKFKLVDRGIKRARWSVLTGCNKPGILFEGGFVTNSTECRLIAAPSYRQAIADSIGDAVTNYRRALQPRVGQQTAK